MKALYLSLGAMALILAFSLWAGSYVARQTTDCSQLLEEAASAGQADDWNKAQAALHLAKEQWLANETFFHTIIEHSELNEAQALFAAAEEACAQQDKQSLSAQLVLLRVQLRRLAETQAVSIKNIL